METNICSVIVRHSNHYQYWTLRYLTEEIPNSITLWQWKLNKEQILEAENNGYWDCGKELTPCYHGGYSWPPPSRLSSNTCAQQLKKNKFNRSDQFQQDHPTRPKILLSSDAAKNNETGPSCILLPIQRPTKHEQNSRFNAPLRTSLRVRLQSFLPAKGLAIGARASTFFFSFCDLSASLSLPITLSPALCEKWRWLGFLTSARSVSSFRCGF